MGRILFLLLVLISFGGAGVKNSMAMPCETHEPNCDDSDRRGDNDDSDNPEDERPGDPNGPDSSGDEGQI